MSTKTGLNFQMGFVGVVLSVWCSTQTSCSAAKPVEKVHVVGPACDVYSDTEVLCRISALEDLKIKCQAKLVELVLDAGSVDAGH